jgi:ribose transport system ATP-binding protein
LLSVRNLATEKRLADCSFDLHPGEIVGVAALQGMGQSELFNALFGAIPAIRGTVTFDGRSAMFGTPRQALNAGLAFVPEERKTEGLFLELSGRENIAMPVIDRMTRFGLIDSDREARIVNAIMGKVQVDSRALYTRAAAFSGGNQQKMVLAKWLLTKPRVLLLFDPCRGVDVGTKHEIYLLINEFAETGGAVLLNTSETPELVNLCHRIVVLYDGRLTEIESGPDSEISEKAVMTATLGVAAPASAKTMEHSA